MTYHVKILNPKADKLLQDLADLQLIALSKKTADNSFLEVVTTLRKKAEANPPSLDEITKEVENIRSKRYAGHRKA